MERKNYLATVPSKVVRDIQYINLQEDRLVSLYPIDELSYHHGKNLSDPNHESIFSHDITTYLYQFPYDIAGTVKRWVRYAHGAGLGQRS